MHNVVEDLQPLLHPIDIVDPLPGNPRRGHVASIRASLREFGQDKPIVVRRTSKDGEPLHGEIVAGNHTWIGAKEEGWTELAMVWRKGEDAKRGKARAVADNRTTDLSTNDDAALVAMLQEISDNPLLLDAVSYTNDDIEDLLYQIANPRIGEASADRKADYLAQGIRTIALPFSVAEHERMLILLAALRVRYEVDNNSAAVQAALEEICGDASTAA